MQLVVLVFVMQLAVALQTNKTKPISPILVGFAYNKYGSFVLTRHAR